MTTIPALGGGPLTFVDATGKQFSIPLLFVTFPTAPGTPVLGGPLAGNLEATTWLSYLNQQGLVTAGSSPTNPPAFSIAARDAGSAGNDITIAFSNIQLDTANPSQTKLDVTVATTQTYPGLTTASIVTLLGTAPLAGSQPGLAYVGTPPTALPAATSAAAAFTGSPLAYAIPGTDGILLATHATPAEAADAALLTGAIAAATAAKFTLVLAWTKTAAGVALADLNATFAYLISVTAPPGPGGFAHPPAAGTVTLQGGSDPTSTPTPATPAAAVVVAA